MIGAILHRLLYQFILKVPSENMGRMSLFSFTDIPFWIIFRQDWFKLIQELTTFRKNLKTEEWSSLGIVYPRIGILAYSYYLFSWAKYCKNSNTIIAQPDECLFAEVFLSYVCQIDVLIDNPDTRHLWDGNNINKIKLTPQISSTAGELCARINTLSIPRERKKELFRQVISYRRKALNAMRHWAFNSSQTIEEILEDKEKTACSLLAEWSKLLCVAYDIPSEIAQDVYSMFLNFSFLVQLIDDVADSATDYRNHVQNIFIALVRQTESEWSKLNEIINKDVQYVGWRWVKANLPVSYCKLKQLYNKYAELLVADHRMPKIARAMFKIIDSYRGLMEWNL